MCGHRNDLQADDVRLRVQGTVSDLHAADAQYHLDCYSAFMSPRSIQASHNTSKTSTDVVDTAFLQVVEEMERDKGHIWNSVELLDIYTSLGGDRLSRRHLVDCVTKYFEANLIMVSGNGYASLFVFKGHALINISSRIQGVPDAVIIDGCAMQWIVHWPTSGTVEDYVINFMGAKKYHLQRCDVY